MMCCASGKKQTGIFILKQIALSHTSRKSGHRFCVYFSCYVRDGLGECKEKFRKVMTIVFSM